MNTSNKQKYTPERFSHLVGNAGIGAIVRGSEELSMVLVDTRWWKDKNKQCSATTIDFVKRITTALGIDQELKMPPSAEVGKKLSKDVDDIKGSYLFAVLFPKYARCIKCDLLHNNPWKKQGKQPSEDIYCHESNSEEKNKCDGKLEQVMYCSVSSDGNLDEVPWHYVCHGKKDNLCREDYKSNYLKLTTDNNGKKIVQCTRCHAQNRYEGFKITVMSKLTRQSENSTQEITQYHMQTQPWLYENSQLSEGAVMNVLPINDSAIYLPESVKALVIPPESRIDKSLLEYRLLKNSKALKELKESRSDLRKKGQYTTLAREYRCAIDDIKEAIKKINDGCFDYDPSATPQGLKIGEYKAFLEPIENQNEDEDFITSHRSDTWQQQANTLDEASDLCAIIKLVDKLVLAERIREIQIFKGFRRGHPKSTDSNKNTDANNAIVEHDSGDNRTLVSPDITGKSGWLPAIELFGEGVFFTLNENLLQQWENEDGVRKRATEIRKRYAKSSVLLREDITITPRFILLHTLSHLIIREFEKVAGYSANSLNETIYCSSTSSAEDNMAGIFIYTAVPDVVGSLGGIIESGEPASFLKILSGAFKQAQWCSLDPVCGEHQGQGPGWLNRAACHACSLLPETSCEYSNVFLDRIFIKGNNELEIPNLLEFVRG